MFADVMSSDKNVQVMAFLKLRAEILHEMGSLKESLHINVTVLLSVRTLMKNLSQKSEL